MQQYLGTGSFGEVFAARWQGTDVAVKHFHLRGTLLVSSFVFFTSPMYCFFVCEVLWEKVFPGTDDTTVLVVRGLFYYQ